MVEYQLPKLATGVRFPSLAPVLILILALTGCRTANTPYITDTRSIGGTYHYVKGGDTLWSISRLYDVDIKSIVNANNIHDTSAIDTGQRLLIPGAGRYEEERKSFLFKDSFIWPLKGTVISYFGSKMDRTKNKGIDIHAQEGSSVRASKAGRVVLCDQWLKGFGKTVILDHGDNFQTVYAYNSMILVNLGDVVEQNSVIAKAGRTGRAKEPSLHFEIRRDGEPQNPFYYLSR